MLDVYIGLITRGIYTIQNVPAPVRPRVKDALIALDLGELAGE